MAESLQPGTLLSHRILRDVCTSSGVPDMCASHPKFFRLSAFTAFLTVLGLCVGAQLILRPVSAQSTIAFVQVNSATPQTNSTTVALPFTAAQTAGNLNVVVVGWNDASSAVSSVVDSKG